MHLFWGVRCVVVNKIIKGSFAIVGFITGFTLTKTVLLVQNFDVSRNIQNIMFVLVSLLLGVLFYITANQVINSVLRILDKIENYLQNMTLYELTISAGGLIAGLIAANLIVIPIIRIAIIGLPIAIIANVLFGLIGVSIASGKKNDHFLHSSQGKNQVNGNGKYNKESKLLDTSVIIDGRIVDICRSGFMEGELLVPSFVLEELRHIADSSDALKRNRGRRGLDVLNILQKELGYPVKIENIEVADGGEVDDKLLKAAKKINGKIITNDYNLNKVASFHGVNILNINELANAMKPIALPGEEMVIQVIKDGKEKEQGIAYMDDGTMIVVEGGKRFVGETVSVMVTSVIQTAAGRMIFAKPKSLIERVI
jgi:uncharacterized protein YacL